VFVVIVQLLVILSLTVVRNDDYTRYPGREGHWPGSGWLWLNLAEYL